MTEKSKIWTTKKIHARIKIEEKEAQECHELFKGFAKDSNGIIIQLLCEATTVKLLPSSSETRLL